MTAQKNMNLQDANKGRQGPSDNTAQHAAYTSRRRSVPAIVVLLGFLITVAAATHLRNMHELATNRLALSTRPRVVLEVQAPQTNGLTSASASSASSTTTTTETTTTTARRKASSLAVMQSGVYVLHTLLARYKRDLDEVTAERDKLALRTPSKFHTCAVVGNSGALLEHEFGVDVDKHDAVLRLNNAPAGGQWSKHVGSKTTVAVLNGHKLHHCANDTVFMAARRIGNGEAGNFVTKDSTAASTSGKVAGMTMRYNSLIGDRQTRRRRELRAQRQQQHDEGDVLPPGVPAACERCYATYGTATSIFASVWEPYHFDDFNKCRLHALQRSNLEKMQQKYNPTKGAPPAPVHGTLMRANRDLMKFADDLVERAFVDAARREGRVPSRKFKLSHSTGLLAVLFAVGICESVSLYGFDRRGGAANASQSKQHHYFETFTPHEYADHEFDIERDWFADLANGAKREAAWLAERYELPDVKLY